jgi:hypothetical protein
MRPLTAIIRTLLAAVVLLTAGCSVTVPASKAPVLGVLTVGDPTDTDGTTTAPSDAAGESPSDAVASKAVASKAAKPPGTRPLNRAEQLLPNVSVQPWQTPLPVVVQSASKDMQCSIDVDGAACHLPNDVVPRPGDIKGQCTGASEYFGGYAVVTLGAGAQYGLCGNGMSPMEAEEVAGPAFPGPWLHDGETVRLGNMVCERTSGAMTCSHLRTGHGFLISKDGYELW